jgi:hypothetical protein
MAPSDTPWNKWANAFPGSVEKGPLPSYLIMVLPLVFFLLQAFFAQWIFHGRRKSNTISTFYSTLVTINIIGMALLTGPATLNGLLTGYFRDSATPSDSYPTIPLVIWYFTVLAFVAHSVINCCRVVYDAFGLRAAVQFIPFAACFQAWQIIALPFGFSPYLGIVILTIVDYLQHLTSLIYWLYNICTASPDVDKIRLWFGVGGVVLHMIAIVPAMVYVISIPLSNQTTGGLCAIYACSVIMMFASQTFWIGMALRTPPPGATSSNDADNEDERDGAGKRQFGDDDNDDC